MPPGRRRSLVPDNPIVPSLRAQVCGDRPPAILPLTDAIAAGDQLAAALALRAAGVSSFPGKVNGSKEPAIAGWRAFSDRFPTDAELSAWFARAGRHAVCVPGG